MFVVPEDIELSSSCGFDGDLCWVGIGVVGRFPGYDFDLDDIRVFGTIAAGSYGHEFIVVGSVCEASPIWIVGDLC